ncbi:MAG: hypothetical protein NVSMB19_13350 [Vulcanimicrobiaceae bacterium]
MKLDRPQRLVTSLAVCGAVAFGVAFNPSTATGVRAQAAPPPPPAPNSTTRLATPAAAASPLPSAKPVPTASATSLPEVTGRKRRGKPSNNAPQPAASGNPEPSATPTSPAFATLDGTWEFQLQFIDRTEYSYLTIVQGTAGAISGTWKVSGKTYPFDGTYDGRLIRLLVKEPTGNVTMSGYVEGASDMVGTVDLGNGKTEPTAFTAEHRPGSKGSIFKKGV